jgi:hypothetical protein
MKKPHSGAISRSGAVMVGLAGFEPTIAFWAVLRVT